MPDWKPEINRCLSDLDLEPARSQSIAALVGLLVALVACWIPFAVQHESIRS